MDLSEKFILDACCGGRMMGFEKKHKNALYCDIRSIEKGTIQHENWECKPDIIADYKDLPFEDESFNLILWDIPHLIKDGTGIINKKYGHLGENWESDTTKGFNCIWKKLKNNGVLIFKYNDLNIKVSEMLKLFHTKPLFGTISKKGVNNTYFFTFMKIDQNK